MSMRAAMSALPIDVGVDHDTSARISIAASNGKNLPFSGNDFPLFW
jgi:hypothetical protein